MTMPKDICHPSKYTDKEGQEKVSWKKVGTLMTTKKGTLAVKLDMVPVNFDGWLYCFDREEKENAAQKRTSSVSSDLNDDIPF